MSFRLRVLVLLLAVWLAWNALLFLDLGRARIVKDLDMREFDDASHRRAAARAIERRVNPQTLTFQEAVAKAKAQDSAGIVVLNSSQSALFLATAMHLCFPTRVVEAKNREQLDQRVAEIDAEHIIHPTGPGQWGVSRKRPPKPSNRGG